MKEKKIPMRMCVGCRTMYPKKTLIRVVRGADESVSIDPIGKKPGRGAYLCRQSACLQAALKSKALERTFGCALEDSVKVFLTNEMEALKAFEGSKT